MPRDEVLLKVINQSKSLSKDKIAKAQEISKGTDVGLYEALVDTPLIDENDLGKLLADYYKLPYINLLDLEIPEDVIFTLPEEVARKNKTVVFAVEKELVKLAIFEPNEGIEFLKQNLEKKTAKKVETYFTSKKALESTLLLYKKNLQNTVDKLIKQGEIATAYGIERDPPIEKILDLIIDSAYQEKASDIHIEPQDDDCLIRFRLDGILHDVINIPISVHDRIVTRIKVMSGLRTDEHLSAQDGKIHKNVGEEEIDLRVSIIPIVDGEKVVIRLLASSARDFTLTNLGMNEKDLAKVQKAFNKTYGMILSTGPTGSGKTTSIYAILRILNNRDKNITSIEDPVEYRIKGANQIQVNTKTNLTFANGLRSILRQDPDHVFVGEIRDSETASIAVNAALTGHLVLSTLHTNNAATAIPRLIDMKVESFLVASTVNIIIAQRLTRKICDGCRVSYTSEKSELLKHFPSDVLDKVFVGVGKSKTIRLYKGKGCKICHNTGYLGRVGVFEILVVSEKIRRLITDKAEAEEIEKQARVEGMVTMMQDGLEKMAKGLTTLEEIMRVIKTEGDD